MNIPSCGLPAKSQASDELRTGLSFKAHWYNAKRSTASVNFQTTRPVYATDYRKSHVSHVVLDSPWEQELARVLEAHPRVFTCYTKRLTLHEAGNTRL
jgi:hypothetical protein